MFRVASWSVSVLSVAIVLASLVCGAFGAFAVSAEDIRASAIDDCHRDGHAERDIACLEHCLSLGDCVAERVAVESVALADVVFETPVVWERQSILWNRVKHAPPWQGHRLFAFRE